MENHSNTDNSQLQFYAIVELMGHQKIAGSLSEYKLGADVMLRVDVPSVNGRAAFTKFYSPKAIYGVTPTDLQTMEAMAKSLDVKPLDTYTISTAVNAALEKMVTDGIVTINDKRKLCELPSDPFNFMNDDGI